MSGMNVMKTRTPKSGVMKATVVATNTVGGSAMRHHEVLMARFATWISFAGAVGLQAAVMLICFRAISDKFSVNMAVLPAVLALLALAMIAGGRRVAQQNRPAVAARPRLRLVGDADAEEIAAPQRTAA